MATDKCDSFKNIQITHAFHLIFFPILLNSEVLKCLMSKFDTGKGHLKLYWNCGLFSLIHLKYRP